MIKNFIEGIKKMFLNLDAKILRILKYGLKFSSFILLISVSILIANLTFAHSIYTYQIGLLVFELSLYFATDFIISAIAIDIIHKQLI